MRLNPPAQPDAGANGYAPGAPEETDAAEAPAPDDDDDGDGLVEVQHEGKTYTVPTALKGALMRHADYTRKTQELAQHRRALEAGHQALQQAAEAHGAHLADCARLVALRAIRSRGWSNRTGPRCSSRIPAGAQQL